MVPYTRSSLLIVWGASLLFADGQTYPCFAANGNAALKTAVADYAARGTASQAAKTYGPVIGDWCVSRVTSFAQVFMGLTTFNKPLTNWVTSNGTNFSQMFEGCTAFEQNLQNFDVRKATTLRRMFYNAKAFTGRGLPSWNVSSVTDLYWTFKGSAFNRAVGTWDVSRVTDLRETFASSKLNQNLCDWGSKLKNVPAANLVNTFQLSSCPIKTNSNLTAAPAGPFCYQCFRWGTDCYESSGVDLQSAVWVRKQW